MADIIQIRRDTASNWTAANPILAQGEFGVETNTSKIKIGNGSSTWSALSYLIDAGDYLTASSTNTLTNKTIAYADNTLTGVVGTAASQTLTNKTIAYADNTLTGVAGVTATQTLTNKTLTDPAIIGTILEDIFTITDGAAFEIDPSNGSIQLITLGASRTPKATNFVNGEAVTLMVDDGSAYTLTWTDSTFGGSGVVWKTNAGAAPTLNTTGYTVMVLWEVGGQVYGARVGDA